MGATHPTEYPTQKKNHTPHSTWTGAEKVHATEKLAMFCGGNGSTGHKQRRFQTSLTSHTTEFRTATLARCSEQQLASNVTTGHVPCVSAALTPCTTSYGLPAAGSRRPATISILICERTCSLRAQSRMYALFSFSLSRGQKTLMVDLVTSDYGLQSSGDLGHQINLMDQSLHHLVTVTLRTTPRSSKNGFRSYFSN